VISCLSELAKAFAAECRNAEHLWPQIEPLCNESTLQKRNAYLVEFVDDEDTDGSIPQRVVSQRYVLALRQ
jgi:hypothetical protein